LEAVFEADFLECSYGFRPGRNPHGALRALRGIIVTKKVGHLLEADIRGYFNHIQHDWLQKMVAHRIADPLILRLIGKWLNAGFMVGGVVTRTEEGSPQGGPISPILSNIYLHFALDLWFAKKIRPACQGEAYLTRFADDFVVNLQYRRDAEEFHKNPDGSIREIRIGVGGGKDAGDALRTLCLDGPSEDRRETGYV
jgi:RNA-directed DNA polymerase